MDKQIVLKDSRMDEKIVYKLIKKSEFTELKNHLIETKGKFDLT